MPPKAKPENTKKKWLFPLPACQRLEAAVKRSFDIVASLLGLIVLSPVFLFVMILIKRDSEGPVFYRGPRVGKNGKIFQILKFRTMYECPGSHMGPRLTCSEDQRITRLGRWLRNTKINELPQLWNVLRGDMSMVGPRPEDPEFIGSYPDYVCNEILSVRPGITSPASVLYHSEQDLLSKTNLIDTYLREILPDKIRLDQLYVRHRSFASDLDIIFWTLAVFIPRIAKTNIPEGYLFAGPLSRFLYRHFSWFLADMVVVLAATVFSVLIWRTQGPLYWGWDYLVLLSFCFSLAFSAVNYVSGLNRIVWSMARDEDAFGLLFSAGIVTSLALILNHLQARHQWFPIPPLPEALILSVGLLAHLGFLSVRYRLRLLTWLAEGWSALKGNPPGIGERMLILGEGERCHIATWLLKRGMLRHAFSVVGIVSHEDPTKQGMRINGYRVIGGVRDLPALVKQHDVRMIACMLPGTAAYIRDMVFEISKTSSIKLVFLEDLVAFVSPPADRPAAAREYLEWLQQRRDLSSLRDAVTGLPNAALLQDRVHHSIAYARRYHTAPALMLIDLNGSVPDENAENELLKSVAQRLLRFKRESDTLARFDGHEFALLLENVPNETAAETILKRTRALMAEPFAISDRKLSVRAEIGLYASEKRIEEVMERLRMKQAGQLLQPDAASRPLSLVM